MVSVFATIIGVGLDVGSSTGWTLVTVPYWVGRAIWISGLLITLLIAPFLVFHKVRQQREVLRRQLNGLLETPMLDFGGFKVTALLNPTNPSLADFDIALLFDNISPARLRYRVESVSVELVGKTANNANFTNMGASISPGRQAQFLYPMIQNVDLSNSPLDGRIEYTIEYVTIPEIRKFRQRRKIAISIYPPRELVPGGTWYVRHTYLESPDDEAISISVNQS